MFFGKTLCSCLCGCYNLVLPCGYWSGPWSVASNWMVCFYPVLDMKSISSISLTHRSGLVAYHILQSGVSCRLPKTPRSEFCRLGLVV